MKGGGQSFDCNTWLAGWLAVCLYVNVRECGCVCGGVVGSDGGDCDDGGDGGDGGGDGGGRQRTATATSEQRAMTADSDREQRQRTANSEQR